MRYQLSIFSAAYRIVSTDFDAIKGNDDLPGFGSNFHEWSFKSYYGTNLILSEQNVEDIVTFIKHTVINKIS